MPLVLPGHEVSLNEPGRVFDRHHHLGGYAALLVEGACDEAGDCGRFRMRPGDVLFHQPFEAHQDRIGGRGARFLNFVLADSGPAMFGHVADLDAIIRAHERDPHEAAMLLMQQLRSHAIPVGDWPDLLAARLAKAAPVRLHEWADCHALNPASLSRGFRQAFGVTPKRYRFEQMTSRAARRVRRTSEPLSEIATACGFADQAHMTRAFRTLFGITPRGLRGLS